MISQQISFPNAHWMTEDHLMFEDMISRFYADEVTPNAERWIENGQVDRDFWRKAGEMGLIGAATPEAYGGSGGDRTFEASMIYQYFRTGDSCWGISIQSIVMHYVLEYGNEEQKQKWVPGMVSGDLVGALGMTEPSTGSDLKAIRTTATRDGDHYVINGSKTFITNGVQSDVICLACKTDKDAGSKGVSLIMVEVDGLEGFQKGEPLKKIGLKGNDTCELFFDNCRVPVSNLLGEQEGQGFYQMMKQLPWERLAIAIGAIAVIDFAIDETVKYTQERKAFGQRIFDFQNTKFKLAELKTQAEVLRSFTADCLGRLVKGELDTATASMAKWWGSQVQNEVVDECVQLFGGYGFMAEYPVARLYGDSRIQKIYGGTNEIMKDLIARSLDA
jgi:alkylation response protein AidB-like acyl-CoA dehydrogenase